MTPHDLGMVPKFEGAIDTKPWQLNLPAFQTSHEMFGLFQHRNAPEEV